MIQRDRNLQAKQNVQKIIVRAESIKNTLTAMFQYIAFTQQSYQGYCRDIFKDLTSFENKISKACRYEPDKTNMILRLSRQYRQFPSKMQNYAEVNLSKIPSIQKTEELNKHEMQLKKKAQTFQIEFKNYVSSINQYNSIYHNYMGHCMNLDQIISKFKSYSDPLKFYNKSITSQYQQKLELSLNSSKNEQIKVTTELQLLDSKRRFLDELIKQIREMFTHLFHTCLKFIQTIVNQIADPGKDSYPKDENKLNSQNFIEAANESSKNSETYQVQFERLSNFTAIIDQGNEIMADFQDIMKDKKSKKFNEQIVADHKLFSIRCDNIKSKKQKAFQECLNLHSHLLEMFDIQIKRYKQFQKTFKEREKKIFGLSGKESYKKDFQIFFGAKAYQLHELCFYIIEIPRRSFEQINVWINDNFINFKEVTQSKKQSILKFIKFYEEIMKEHLNQKQKFQSSDPSDTQVSQIYRKNIVSSLDQFRYIFTQLEAKQLQKDKVVTQKLVLMHKFIAKQFNLCKIHNILDTHKQKFQILKNFKIISEAMLVFKSDQLYNILYEQFFGSSLQKKFESKINSKQYSEAQSILKQKEKIAKKMLKKQIGCCGLIKAKPIESEVYSSHKCSLINNEKTCVFGTLKILKEGLTFQESKWNPFAQKVHILIPKSDVQSIESKTFNQNSQESVVVNTEKGFLTFTSNKFDELYAALQKTYGQTYSRSLAIDRINTGKNDSTQSGGLKGTSMMVSYKKQQKMFVQSPVCMNPALNKMNLSESIDKPARGSNNYLSIASANSEYYIANRPRAKSQSEIKDETKVRLLYNKLMMHYNKHQFLPDQFLYLQKTYKSDARKDFEFKDIETHNLFLLKELKRHSLIETISGLVLEIVYEWKVAYPNNSLHSFKHGEKIVVDLNPSPSAINIIEWPHTKQQIFNRHLFYQNIKKMNQKVWKYIVQNTNRDFLYESVIQKEYDPLDNSEDYFIDQFKQPGMSYPEQLQIKGSRIGPQVNELKLQSFEKGDLKASSVRSKISFRKSSTGESGQGFYKMQDI